MFEKKVFYATLNLRGILANKTMQRRTENYGKMTPESKYIYSTLMQAARTKRKLIAFIFTDMQIPWNTQTTIRYCCVGLTRFLK